MPPAGFLRRSRCWGRGRELGHTGTAPLCSKKQAKSGQHRSRERPFPAQIPDALRSGLRASGARNPLNPPPIERAHRADPPDTPESRTRNAHAASTNAGRAPPNEKTSSGPPLLITRGNRNMMTSLNARRMRHIAQTSPPMLRRRASPAPDAARRPGRGVQPPARGPLPTSLPL